LIAKHCRIARNWIRTQVIVEDIELKRLCTSNIRCFSYCGLYLQALCGTVFPIFNFNLIGDKIEAYNPPVSEKEEEKINNNRDSYSQKTQISCH
jgi:hypothetical protein